MGLVQARHFCQLLVISEGRKLFIPGAAPRTAASAEFQDTQQHDTWPVFQFGKFPKGNAPLFASMQQICAGLRGFFWMHGLTLLPGALRFPSPYAQRMHLHLSVDAGLAG